MRRTWRLILWSTLLLGVVIGGALAKAPDDTLLWKALFDAGHALFSGLLALLCLGIVLAWRKTRTPTFPDMALAFTGAVGIGAVFEIVQFYLPRDADPGDLLRDAAGAAAFLLLAWSVRRHPVVLRLAALVTALLLLGIVYQPVMAIAWATRQRDAALPVLCEAGAPWLSPFLVLQNADWEVVDDRAQVTFRANPYPGFALRETTPDWRRYEALAMQVFSDLQTPVDIVLRIDDATHDQSYSDRFNRRLVVVPGPQVFRIPLQDIRTAPKDRDMDLAHMRKVVVFAAELQEPFKLAFGPIWLE